MKNFILKYYNIRVDKVYNKNGHYYFFINDDKVYIIKYKGEIDYLNTLYKITIDLFNNKKYIDTFIINNKGDVYTHKNDYYIVLLKENNRKINIELKDLINFFNIDCPLKDYNILEDWKNEIDTIEKELIEYNNEYEEIQNSIDYFIGSGENAIALLGIYSDLIKSRNDSICHKLTYSLFKNDSIYNPFLFIKSNKMYDISNYIKYKFFLNDLDYDEIYSIITRCDEYESVLLFSCLMYPNVYFDLVKRILLKSEKEEKILFYIKNVNSYKQLLLFCKDNIQNKYIKLINWIK